MAKKISQLATVTSTSDSDTYPVVQSGTNKKATGKQISQHYTDFTTLSGTVWDGTNKVKTATANVALTFSPGTNRFGQLIFIQDGTGGRTLSIEGNSIAVVTDANAVSVISYFWDLASSKFRFFLASSVVAITGTAPDTTAPTVSSRATGSTTTIVITLSENVTSTTAGWSFKKNGTALAITSVSGSGTNQLTFTVASMAFGDTLTCSYNSGTGDCKDVANNTLASFTDQSVTNGIGGLTQLSTPTLTATVISDTEIDLSWTNVANESSYKLEWSANGTSGWTQIGGTIAANTTSYNHTGLTGATHYYYRISAIGDGVTYSTSNFGTDDDTTSVGATYIAMTSAGGASAVTESPTGTFTTASTGDGQAKATSVSLAASANGSIQQKYLSSANIGAIVGFKTTNTNGDYSSFTWGVFNSAGVWKKIEAGVITILQSGGVDVPVSVNDIAMVERVSGNTFHVKINGVVPTDNGILATTSTAQVYACLDISVVGNSVSEVKGIGLT
jgi:hypothetical protein